LDSFSGFLNNAALMLILCVIYDTFDIYSISNKKLKDILTGVLVGLICIAVMLSPWSLEKGLYFDTRWVLLSLCGLYFGFIPTVVAVVFAGTFRLYQNGPGGIVGTVVIVVTACVGLAWRYWKDKHEKPLNWLQLYVFGVAVQLAMLSCMFLFPADLRNSVLKKIALPILLIYPILTTIIGLILKRQEDRRATYKELAENRKTLNRERGLLKGVINSIPDLIFFKNMDGVYLGCNRSFEEFIGREEQHIVGKTDFDLFDKDTAEFFVQKDNVIYKSGKPGINEEWVDYPDGKKILLDTVKTPLKDLDGTLYGLVGISRNITERKQTEEALASSERFLKTIIDSEPECIKMLDINGNLLMMNPAGLVMIGADSFEQVKGESVCPLITEPYRETFIAQIKQVFQGVPGTLEFEIIGLRGRHVWLETHAVPFRNEHGEIVSLLAITRDVTERKRAENERIHLERQILHAQKLDSLGVLAGGIAHDFNNILTSIIGNADLALMRINPESPAIDNLHSIEKASVRAADLAKQMLAYSGKGKFVISNHDINGLLEEMLHILQVSISKKAVLRLNLTRPLPPVEADATQLRQIIMNLVINASEAIGDKSGVIAITTGCMDCDRSYLKDVWLDENIGDGLYVFIEIADTGCGMSKDTLAKLFDPFFTTKFTGRGLGMAAVLGIVRGHKGAVKVYSEQGKGSAFKILLPASGKPVEIFNHDSQNDHWKGSGTVLLVDDEETVRGIGTEMLKELGFNVVTANDGREAIEAYKAGTDFSYVILDLTMPHMDGEQCFRELRILNPDIKVIMSSGFSELEVTQKFVGKGLAGFIQKPYKLSVLREGIMGLYPVNK
jgi:PAS domain S-box-containing protein